MKDTWSRYTKALKERIKEPLVEMHDKDLAIILKEEFPAAFPVLDWRILMELAYNGMIKEFQGDIDDCHTKDTASRVVRMYDEIFHGVKENPASPLLTGFLATTSSEMIVEKDIPFVSFCAHHLLPFSGVVHFGYIPNSTIVGLSKIPRMIDILAARPQVQENLTWQIAYTFNNALLCEGVGVIVEAKHACVECRGVRKPGITTITSTMVGVFAKEGTKAEFTRLIR